MNIVSRLSATILALVIAFPVLAQSTSPTGKTAPANPSATAPAKVATPDATSPAPSQGDLHHHGLAGGQCGLGAARSGFRRGQEGDGRRRLECRHRGAQV